MVIISEGMFEILHVIGFSSGEINELMMAIIKIYGNICVLSSTKLNDIIIQKTCK